jgi:hypothetical protein
MQPGRRALPDTHAPPHGGRRTFGSANAGTVCWQADAGTRRIGRFAGCAPRGPESNAARGCLAPTTRRERADLARPRRGGSALDALRRQTAGG